jgi:hypothetical protein
MSTAWRSHGLLDAAFDRALAKEDKRDLRLRRKVALRQRLQFDDMLQTLQR